jgi:hypothetical protein
MTDEDRLAIEAERAELMEFMEARSRFWARDEVARLYGLKAADPEAEPEPQPAPPRFHTGS